MNTFNKLVSTVCDAFEFNEAVWSGCVDIVVIKQKDGSYKATGFHARFGKVHVIKSKDMLVKIEINDKPTSVTMKLGKDGEAYFEEEVTDCEENELADNSVYNGDLNCMGSMFWSSKKSPIRKKSGKSNDFDASDPKKKLVIPAEQQQTQPDVQKTNRIFNKILGSFTKEKGGKNQLNIERIVSSKLTDNVHQDDISPTEKENEICTESTRKLKKESTTSTNDSDPENSAEKDKEPKPREMKDPSGIIVGRVRKTLRLSSEKIKLLNLRPGQNTITYIIETDLQGTQKIQANIFLWSYTSKIIVTDVDGTITRSDVLGAILPILGKDWTQPGIAPLFDRIHRNGYHVLYLSSRAIGQISFTRHFVKTVMQDDCKLPQGPIISSPDLLLPCFKREIVFSKPEYFKSAALRDIRNLFPPDEFPFHAGFGNRENDAVAYRYIGIPLENIFTSNGSGDIHHTAHTIYRSYAQLNAKVKEMFPCIYCILNHYSTH